MKQIAASESRIELPRQIAQEPSISKIIEIAPTDEQILAPKARIVFASNAIQKPSYQTKRTSCHYLLQTLLCSISATQRHCWELEYSASGAPALASDGNHSLYISMARSGNWLAAGVSYQAKIGIDIECIKPRTNISERAEFLNWKVPVVDLKDFYAKWTLWEASAKCVRGSVLMKNNPGFDKLCRIDTRDRIGRCEHWSGLHDCLDEQAFYAVVLQSENNTDLNHKTLCPGKTETWSVSNTHYSARALQG